MAVRTANAFAQPLRTLFRVGVVGGLSDRQLLDRFATGHREDAEAAFRALMDRHGPMVLRACRVVLDDPHDAEDAFQATFLILARQAGSIRDRGSVASWLHRIAWRIAAHARAAAARRRQIERQTARPAAQPGVDPERLILDTILHEELIRLPEKYRKPIVLCYLEGLTHEGAAEQLGWPVGTVRGRLARARDLLRARLTRRGVTSPAVVAPTSWFSSTSMAEAAVPTALRDSTVEVVLQVTSGQTIAAVVSAHVAAVMEAAPRVMAMSRWKIVAGLLILVGAVGVGSGLSMGRQSVNSQQSAEPRPQSPSSKNQVTIPSAGGNPSVSQPEARARRDVTIEGTVVDAQGKPVADAQVLFHAPLPRGDRVESVEVRTKTDAAGRYRLTTPPLGGVNTNGAKVWAYRSGSAVAAGPWYQPPALVLRRPEPKTVKIEGPDGQPVVGARVSPRLILFAAGELTNVPDSLAASRAVSTGSDGKAILDDLAAAHQLVAVRVTADSIGTQDFQLIERPFGAVRNVQGATITIRLKPTSRLAGRVRNREGQPVANQAVEIWYNGGSALQGNPVGFKNGLLRTAADGSFQTPDNLLVGSSYRIVVRAPGMEPILSDWITIGDKPRVLLPMIQRPLRTISGRVVDRQGKPVLGVEVFQAGDGPERTATRIAANGQFTLGGFMSQRPVFLFARGEGFRFFGRMIKPGEGDVTVELTRTSERPSHPMKMLADPIPLEESRALAQRLLKPYWEAVENKNEFDKSLALRSLAMADPVGVLRKLEDIEFSDARAKSMIQNSIVAALARIDPIQAAAVAESIEAPFLRAIALEQAVDALPERERNRKLALLDAAAVLAKADPISKVARAPISRFNRMGEVAERWYVLGEKAKAKTLLAEGLRLSNQTPRRQDNQERLRGRFAARLAHADLPSALAIAKQFPASGRESTSWVLRNIAFHLAADNPAEAERVLRQIPPETVRDWFPPAIAWKMAAVDPARAQRLTEESQRYFDHPQSYLFLALGLKSRDQAAAVQAFQTAMRGIDRLMKDEAEYSNMLGFRQVLLPLVEQIDPALVPEFFWRIVATRPSVGNPRHVSERSISPLIVFLAWYDRDVAAALFEPIRGDMERTDNRELARWVMEFQGWSIFDPRAAVARLEQVPVDPNLDLSKDTTREMVAETLGLLHEARWRFIWLNYTEMADLLQPDELW